MAAPEPPLPQWVYIFRALSRELLRWALLGLVVWKASDVDWAAVLEKVLARI